MKKQNKKGFTLVELLVVIAILAILGTVSIVGYTSFTAKAKQSNANTEARELYDIILANTVAPQEYEVSGSDTYTISFDSKTGINVNKTETGTSVSAEIIFTKIIGTDSLVKGAQYGCELADLGLDSSKNWDTSHSTTEFIFDKICYVSTNNYASSIDLITGTISDLKNENLTDNWATFKYNG